MYIEVDGNRYPCEVEISTTQIGSPLVRVISEAPVATNGFKIINGETEVDKSDFTYLYREDGIIKEYCQNEEEIIPAESNQLPCPVNPMQEQISALNRRITDITPYTATKEAYYGEIEKIFYDVPNGNLSVFFDNYNGEYEAERIADRVVVTFYETVEEKKDEETVIVRKQKRLTDMTSITIMIQ